MRRSFALASALAMGLLASSALFGDEPKGAKDNQETAKEETKSTSKGKTVPFPFSKIGLSDEQKKEFLAITAKYKAKRDALSKQLAELLKSEKDEKAMLLTDDQKVALQKAMATKVLGEKEAGKVVPTKPKSGGQ